MNLIRRGLPCLLMLMPSLILAAPEWTRVVQTEDPSIEMFIDETSIRQTGPMNIMRRVWEISNLTRKTEDAVMSIQRQVEYDCMERRYRLLQESRFAASWAQGELLSRVKPDAPLEWRSISKGSAADAVFLMVCPYDDSDANVQGDSDGTTPSTRVTVDMRSDCDRSLYSAFAAQVFHEHQQSRERAAWKQQGHLPVAQGKQS